MRTIQVTDAKWVTGDGWGVGTAGGSLKVRRCSSASRGASWGDWDTPLGCLLHSRLQGPQASPVGRWTLNWLMGLFFPSGWGCQYRATQSQSGKYIQGNTVRRRGRENSKRLFGDFILFHFKSQKFRSECVPWVESVVICEAVIAVLNPANGNQSAICRTCKEVKTLENTENFLLFLSFSCHHSQGSQ